MDAPKNPTDQQPSEISIQRDKAHPQAKKICWRPSVFNNFGETSGSRKRWSETRFFQAARPAGLYRRIWASCVPKPLDEEKLGQNNKASRGASINPSDGKDGLQLRPDEQLSRLHLFKQALKLSQERLMGVLKDWNQCSKGDLAVLMDIERCA